MEKLNSWLALIANLGVIAGIVFLGFEIRQSSTSIETAAYQDLIGRIVEINMATATDEELTTVVRAASAGGELSDSDGFRYRIYLVSWIRHADLAYFLYERGVITEERLRSTLSPLTTILANNRAKEIWLTLKSRESFSSEFFDYIDRFLQ